ncbi:MAG: DUF370 domain-containing protein [Desulfobacula sp.]|nr:DUF370 domain-containing protein [Desulfobacula sp.]
MEQLLLTVGFGNTVVAQKVVAILSPNSSPMKRVKDEAREEKRLIDVTHGRKTRAMIIMESNHVILSMTHAETLSNKFESLMNQEEE